MTPSPRGHTVGVVRGYIGRAHRLPSSVALVVALVLGAVACAGPVEAVPVPRFDAVAATPPEPAGDDAGIPDDCERILPSAQLVALLGLPLGSVVAQTTIGVPEPSVGRVERVACRYRGVQKPVRGDTLLELNMGRYVDDASAARQWRVNVDVESGPRRPVPFGTAQAVVLERAQETLLSVVNRDVALTVTMPAGTPRPPGRSSTDTLVDLTLRLLAVLAPATPREPGAAG